MKATLIKEKDYYELYKIDPKDGCRVNFASSDDIYKLKLSLKNCQAIESGYDLDELVDEEFFKFDQEVRVVHRRQLQESLSNMFKKALEILSDKKFSKDSLIDFYIDKTGYGMDMWSKEENSTMSIVAEYIQSLQQTEWDVEIVTEKDCYSSAGRCDNLTMADCMICTPVTYLQDADNCLILKRIEK